MSDHAAIAFLHGLGTGPSAWEPQRRAFLASRPVLTPRVTADLETVAPELDAFAVRNGAIDLVGLSLGGLAALRYAASHDTVRRLVVCAGFVSLPPDAARKVSRVARGLRFLPGPVVRRGLTADVPEPYDEVARRELHGVSGRDVSQAMRVAATADLSAEVARIQVPTLVLCGARDEPNLPLSRALAEALPAGSFREVPNAGHVANLDAPDAFTAALREFLDGQ